MTLIFPIFFIHISIATRGFQYYLCKTPFYFWILHCAEILHHCIFNRFRIRRIFISYYKRSYSNMIGYQLFHFRYLSVFYYLIIISPLTSPIITTNHVQPGISSYIFDSENINVSLKIPFHQFNLNILRPIPYSYMLHFLQ